MAWLGICKLSKTLILIFVPNVCIRHLRPRLNALLARLPGRFPQFLDNVTKLVRLLAWCVLPRAAIHPMGIETLDKCASEDLP